ncbi:hypothetical protein GCM10011380_00270 [Sphingomonas metalli]|uniref:Uncharacterized protein n=1 Tax=Sphingomonas metalli TaxID=1779358 RepID=A0A916SUT3_9SPHN|nr:hypothetical protein [Sphingomonas metalli]GGB14809.1 hypothetical protein GCM10011380_00270 [Sphingomonas metalli]
MFGFITRAEHERVLRQLADTDDAHRKLFEANRKLVLQLHRFTGPRKRDGKGRYLPEMQA